MNEERNGNDYSIEQLMREHGNAVLRTAYAYVNDRDAAEDLFQEVFIKAYYNMDKFRGDCSIKSWLIRITINVCKDYLKSAYQQKVVPMMEFEEDAIVSDDDFEEIENADRNKTIRQAVESLPETYREVVMSVYFNEMSVAETAEALGIAEGTVKSRLSRARDVLKNKLEGRI
jgi:RNA polymerase sigma-70 factor (ECF subfamily)